MIFVGLAAVASAVLNSFHIFALPAATSIVFNLAMIACSFGAVYRPIARLIPNGGLSGPALALAIGVLVGSVLQLAVQIPSVSRQGLSLTPTAGFTDAGVRRVGQLMGPGILAACLYQLNFILGTVFATSGRLPSGSVASLYVAERLMQLVLGSYAIAISTALLPAMSHQAAAGNYDEMKRTFGFSVRIVSFITIPAAVGLILLREPIVRVLFQHGQFTAQSTALTANALVYYALGLPAYAGIRLITPMYYSTQDTHTPARIGMYTLAANFLLNVLFLLVFYWQLSNGSPALASSICAYVNFVALFALFRGKYGSLHLHGVTASISQATVLRTVAMGAFAWEVLSFWRGTNALCMATAQAGMLGFDAILAALAAHFGLAKLLQCEELGEFLLMLQARGTGRPCRGPEFSR